MKRKKILVLTIVLMKSFVFSQETNKNESKFNLEEILVVGDRSAVKVKESTIPSGILSSTELQSLPIKTLADAIEYLPGITFSNLDASGHSPIPIIRGYYGGGEAEYVLLLVDGVPVNDFNNGIADWNIIPINHVEKIELIRGGGSSSYGDLAVGGVINVITKQNILENNLNATVNSDQYNQTSINVRSNYQRDLSSIGINLSSENAAGYRDHSEYKKNTLSGSYSGLINENNSLSIDLRYDLLSLQNSGALTQNLFDSDHLQSHSMYAEDYREYEKLGATIQFSRGTSNKLSILSGIRALDQDEARTIQLTSELGDSQFEKQTSTVIWNQIKYQTRLNKTKIHFGLDSEYGFFTSNYKDIDKKQKLSDGSGSGNKLGLYLQAKRNINDNMSLIAAMRLDNIDNEGKIDSSTKNMRLDSHLSPRIGLSYRYMNSEAFEGYFFSNWSKAFKSPTLDQLFDSRKIVFFYQSINYSNSSIVPQESSNIDIGLNQKFLLPSLNLSGEASLVYYTMDIENEIDFMMSTFKYGNIPESTHKGVEASLGLFFGDRLRLRHSSNFTQVKFGSGENKGKLLKSIPELSYSNRISYKISDQLSVLLSQKYFGSVYLNDENTESLPSYNIFDSHIKYRISNYSIDLSIFNIGDKLYSSSAYMLFDAMTYQNVKFLYPAQKRNIRFSLSYSL
tara:strand:+ start:1494 stop:3533 length:2040 start_codon:yes stop_codon:yes gene_type:complete